MNISRKFITAVTQRAGLAYSVAFIAFGLQSPPANAGSANAAVTDAGAAKARTLGFAVTSFPYALYKGADDCPDGMAIAAKAIYLAAATPPERARLTRPENLAEFEQKAYHTPDGKDLCEAPDYPRAPQRTPQGKISFGENLDGTTDGAATETTCAHQKFAGPNGEADWIVMDPDIDFAALRQGFARYMPLGLLISAILAVEMVLISTTVAGNGAAAKNPLPDATGGTDVTTAEAIGRVLYTDYVYFFQAAGMVLLVAMIGAIVLTLRHKPGVRRQIVADQVLRTPKTGMRIVDLKPGEGVGE